MYRLRKGLHESGAEKQVSVGDSVQTAETAGEVEPSQHGACEMFGFATDIIIYQTYAVFLGPTAVVISGDYNAIPENRRKTLMLGATMFSLAPSPSKNSAFQIIRTENDVMCLHGTIGQDCVGWTDASD